MPCVAELPDLVEVAAKYHDEGGRLLAISHDLVLPDRTVDQVRDFARRKRYEFPILVFPGEDFEAVVERFDVPGPIPFTLAVDRTGQVVDHHEGIASPERLEQMMRAALGKSD